MPRIPFALLLASLLALPGCDETDVVALRVTVREDLSGSVRTSALRLPSADGQVQQASEGIVWGSRVEMVCATGTFVKVDQLKVADIVFTGGAAGEGIGFVRVVLPRGPDVRWTKAFVPLTVDERKSVAGAVDPSGRAEAVGETLKIEVELPSAVVGNGVIGKTRGTKASAEGAVATLIVPLETVSTPGDPITWHLTWSR